MQSQNGADRAAGMVDLNEIINLILEKAESCQEPSFFDFMKVYDQVIMSGIKKYTMDVRKLDFTGFDVQTIEDAVENVSTDLHDSIMQSNLDYFRHGIKIGARLLAELII